MLFAAIIGTLGIHRAVYRIRSLATSSQNRKYRINVFPKRGDTRVDYSFSKCNKNIWKVTIMRVLKTIAPTKLVFSLLPRQERLTGQHGTKL